MPGGIKRSRNPRWRDFGIIATYSECSRFSKSTAGARSPARVTIKGETNRRGAAPVEAGRKWNASTQVYQKLLPLITETLIYKLRSKIKYRKKSRECSHRTTRCITLLTSKQPDVQSTRRSNWTHLRHARGGGQGSVFMPHLHRYTQHYSHLKHVTRLPPLCRRRDAVDGTGSANGASDQNQPVFTADWSYYHDDLTGGVCAFAASVSPKSPTSHTSQWAKGFVKWALVMSVISPMCNHPFQCVCGTKSRQFSSSSASKGQGQPAPGRFQLVTVSGEKLDGENSRFSVYRVPRSPKHQYFGEQTYFEHTEPD